MCTYFDENFLNLVPAEHVEGLYGCLDYYRAVGDPFSTALLAASTTRGSRAARSSRPAAPARACTAACALGGRSVARPARSTQEDVIKALDTRSIAEGPGVLPRWSPGSTTSA